MAQPQTSVLAYDKYKADGKKERDEKIILWVLETFGNLTAFGIAKHAFYKQKDNFGVIRTYKLNYVAVNRRMAQLREKGLVEHTEKVTDSYGGQRMCYKII